MKTLLFALALVLVAGTRFALADGPLIVYSNPTGQTRAGEDAGLRLWMGDNPTATPGAGDNVVQTIGAVNGNGRHNIYGLDILSGVCTAAVCGAGYNDAAVHDMEIEVGSLYPATQLSPWGGGYRKNGLEFTAEAGSVGLLTAAAEVWANDNSGRGWWNVGLGLSRVHSSGILCQSDPNGVVAGTTPADADAVDAFQIGCIDDSSNSHSVVHIGPGRHAALLDLTSATDVGLFVQGKASADTTVAFANMADHGMQLAIGSGSQAPATANLTFADRGRDEWIISKSQSNDLLVSHRDRPIPDISVARASGTVSVPTMAVTQQLLVPFGTPSSSSAPCLKGQVQDDASFHYVCVATNLWKRAALSSF